MSATPIVFSCGEDRLLGLIEGASLTASVGVLVIVGGPQYRVGSHRQFTELARSLAAAGYPAMRFDHRGIGDSEGETTFEELGPDIDAALNAFLEACPQLKQVVVWGLCDAASAILMETPGDDRVAGAVLSNPWVRSEETLARSYLSDYYLKQLVSGSFWRRLIGGDVSIGRALSGAFGTVAKALRPAVGGKSGEAPADGQEPARPPFQKRMLQGLAGFQRPILLILSGDDVTANEFRQFMRQDRSRRRLLAADNITTREMPRADHTFSNAEAKAEVTRHTLDWLGSIGASNGGQAR